MGEFVRRTRGGVQIAPVTWLDSPGALGFNMEQISDKLKNSGYVQKAVRNNILKVPENPPGAFCAIQDGGFQNFAFRPIFYFNDIEGHVIPYFMGFPRGGIHFRTYFGDTKSY